MQPCKEANQRPVLPPISSIDQGAAAWRPPTSLPSPPAPSAFAKDWPSPSTTTRTIAAAPATPSRPLYALPNHEHLVAVRQSIHKDMDQIINNCMTMRDTMIRQQHEAVTTPLDDMHHLFNKTPWLEDMIGRANEILNALLRLQKHQLAAQEEKRQSIYYYSPSGTFYTTGSDHLALRQPGDQTIRQRKRRKKTVFQGRCHSCNISETPEWRRGPDGARTLCNACGLHYAKLERKRAAEEAAAAAAAKDNNKDDDGNSNQDVSLLSPSPSSTTTASSLHEKDDNTTTTTSTTS